MYIFSVTVLSIIVPGFFTILYSMEWGPEKANEWLTTFLMSFFQSVIIVQPVKVMFYTTSTSLFYTETTNIPNSSSLV
jgi:polycystin 1L2